MGNKNSYEKGNEKTPYSELLINNNLYSSNDFKHDLRKEFLDMKEEHRKMIFEINHLKEKNQKLEAEVNKIQTNYGQEIFNLLEYCSVLQKDIENMMNNQRIISEFLQTNSRN